MKFFSYPCFYLQLNALVCVSTSAVYSNWVHRATAMSTDKNCIEMLSHGKWTTVDCDIVRPYMCEKGMEHCQIVLFVFIQSIQNFKVILEHRTKSAFQNNCFDIYFQMSGKYGFCQTQALTLMSVTLHLQHAEACRECWTIFRMVIQSMYHQKFNLVVGQGKRSLTPSEIGKNQERFAVREPAFRTKNAVCTAKSHSRFQF